MLSKYSVNVSYYYQLIKFPVALMLDDPLGRGCKLIVHEQDAVCMNRLLEIFVLVAAFENWEISHMHKKYFQFCFNIGGTVTWGLHPARQPWARAEGPFPGACITCFRNPRCALLSSTEPFAFPSPVLHTTKHFQRGSSILFCTNCKTGGWAILSTFYS